ncbi:type IV pilus modification PilV family protein [Roseibacillus persicicus]|uniref:type IV pilus modification PilV family protein n=1 Tax=Roseibacillus persicicus TaxID=454148 RepID=UPI00280E0DE7|nr:type II secretion system protein [Roseibacillus persicicus]MDQ8192042.1 type II secretion system protein [Roseibacillus persicicus]
MKTSFPTFRAAGYTLTEVIIAMAVMAISVPLILGLVVAGSESSRQSERETRGVITARSVFEEIRRALDGNSELIETSDLPWGTDSASNSAGFFGGGGSSSEEGDDDWLILELDLDGAIIGVASDMEYEERWEGENSDVISLAAVRGYGQEVEDAELVPGVPLNVFRVEVRIESPARALAENRSRLTFIKSDSLK